MRDTLFKTVLLNAASATANATEIARANKCPVRVMVRVRGAAGTLATIGFDKSDVAKVESDGTQASCYTIPNGEVDIFVLAPGQTLWAIGSASGVKVCVATSETSCGASA